MAYCTVTEVRNEDKKFAKVEDVTEETITHRIARAEEVIKVDLSSVISETELDTISATSKAVKSLAIYKAVELALVAYYGAGRKTDELSDVQYYQKEYNNLLAKILNGDIILVTPTGSSSPKDYPALDGGSNKKFYVRKGVPGFLPEGESQYGETYVDDSVKS